MQGKDDRGERLLREALKLSPQNAEVYHALGLLLVQKKQMSEAIDALEKSARLKPDNPHYSELSPSDSDAHRLLDELK
jgi:cytochrome c-type biogenesis protein CcmH/NrfG